MASGTVLITGASSGIGEATAHHLKELGFGPVGAVRRDEDAERLGSAGLRTVKLDVTDAESIAAARAELGDVPLAGLVNNAGIAVAAPIEFMPLDQLRRQLEINLVGQVAVTQQFLPALRAGRGRIVNVSSIGGRVALPLMGAYNMSKFGLEAMSDSLRRQIRDGFWVTSLGTLASRVLGLVRDIATAALLGAGGVMDDVAWRPLPG